MKIIPVLFLLLSACVNNSQNKFERIILKNSPKKIFHSNQEQYPRFANYHPLYFGSLLDTIELDYFVQFIPPPPPPRLTTIESLEFDEDFVYNFAEYNPGEFDNYFMSGCFYKEYPTYQQAELNIFVDTSKIIASAKFSYDFGDAIYRKAYPVFIENNTIDTIIIGRETQIPLMLQYKDENHHWINIEEIRTRNCNLGLAHILLPKNNICLTPFALTIGSQKSILRLRLGNNLSNEFIGVLPKKILKN
ncbi:MAG: hypothetical protein ACJAUV_002237 [Flavobacteriales bacterium]|jgi:hypothetical protein